MKKHIKKIWNKIYRIWKLASDFKLLGDVGIIIVAVMIFLRGISSIVYCMFNGENFILNIMSNSVNLKIVQLLHISSIVIGIILMVQSKEILLRIKKSYTFTFRLLIIDAIIILMKDFDYIEILIILIICTMLKLIKKHLYREEASFHRRGYGIFMVLTAIIILIYVLAAPYLQQEFLQDKLIKIKLFKNDKDFLYSGITSYLAAWIILLIRNAIYFKDKFNNQLYDEDKVKVEEFLQNNKGNSNTHLVFLRDKAVYWASEERVMIQYARIGDCLVALGDPIGNMDLIDDAIVEFQNFADRSTLTTAFYRVDKKNISVYHEHGYYFFKLGEEAVVPLEEFDLRGKKKQNLRTAKNKFEKNNYSFEMIYPPYSQELLEILKDISDDWLGERNEDRYSIGWFDEEYLQKSSIGIIKNEIGDVIAFCSTAPYYNGRKIISIDLMRFKKNSPNGIMDLLFLHMILWAKENGYENFSLGMAPLSNVGVSSRSHTQEKFAKFIFNYGNHWYNFKGLRYFKAKFDPVWQPKFFAYQKFSSLPWIMLNISRYIAKPNR